MPADPSSYLTILPALPPEQLEGWPGCPIEGIIQLAGRPDVGKTSFVFECGVHPNRILFIDDDVKGSALVAQLKAAGVPVGGYLNLVTLRKQEKLTELTLFKRVHAILQDLEPGRWDVVVFDTISYFEGAIKPFVSQNRSMFRSNWAPMGTIAGAQEWQEAGLYELAILNELLQIKGVKTIFLVAHMKDDYAETAGGRSVRTGKQVPAVSKAVVKGSVFRLLIDRKPNSPRPYAIVTKQLAKRYVAPGKGTRTIMVTPHRLTLRPGEESLWDVIRRYLDDPVGDRELLEDERVSAEEAELVTGAWGKYDLELIKALTADAASAPPDIDPLPQVMAAAYLAGSTPEQISENMGVALPLVLKALSDAGVAA